MTREQLAVHYQETLAPPLEWLWTFGSGKQPSDRTASIRQCFQRTRPCAPAAMMQQRHGLKVKR